MKTLIAITTLFFSISANAFLIDFDELGLEPRVDLDLGFSFVLPEATFTAVPDLSFEVLFTLNYSRGFTGTNSFPGSICAFESEVDVGCTGVMLIDFATPVNNLSFSVVGHEPDDSLILSIFDRDGLVDTGSLFSLLSIGAPDPFDQLADLSFYSNITRLVVDTGGSSSGGSGMGMIQADVPEPGTLGILGVGLALLVFIRRKRLA